jgi:hypothetical protein
MRYVVDMSLTFDGALGRSWHPSRVGLLSAALGSQRGPVLASPHTRRVFASDKRLFDIVKDGT